MSGQLVLDVSSNNHVGDTPLPWDAIVAAGVKAVIVKTTEGTTYVNPFADGDIGWAKVAGLGWSTYHFLQPTADPAETTAQANFARDNSRHPNLFWIDTEVENGLSLQQVGVACHQMLDKLSTGGFPVVGVYCNLSYYTGMSGTPWNYPLWLAEPSSTSPTVACLLHQYGTQVIGGTAFDVNRWLGTDEQFATLFQLAPPAEEIDMQMSAYDPVTGGNWLSDPDGNLYAPSDAPDQAPYVTGLNAHPVYKAGQTESGGANPVVGIEYWGRPGGSDGIVFYTKPSNGIGGITGTPYSQYRFLRNGEPA